LGLLCLKLDKFFLLSANEAAKCILILAGMGFLIAFCLETLYHNDN